MSLRPTGAIAERIICGMWGTSSLQLSLLDARTGEILETRPGRGVSKLDGASIEKELFRICRDWVDEHSISDLVLGGMVGSTLGWWEVPYLECPTALSKVAAHTVTRSVSGVNIHITPGLKCQNYLDEPDVIRGEEVEMLAWLKTRPINVGERSIVCIPGTHTKWVEVIGDKVTKFHTSVTGEFFDVLTANGVLTTKSEKKTISRDAFLAGVDSAMRHRSSLLQLLMSVRSRSLLSGQTAEEASDRLSGLLIGSDIAAALNMTGFENEKDLLPVIGAKDLAERYALALRHVGVTALPLNALNIGVTGLFEVSKDLRSDS